MNTRPEIRYAVNSLSQAMVRHTKMYWKVSKHVLRYLKGTTEYGLWYQRKKGLKLQCFTDVDWEGSPLDKKSTLGTILSVGSAMIS